MDLPLLEDDLGDEAVIEPSNIIAPIDIPSCAVLCFFREVIESVAVRQDVTEVGVLQWAHGSQPMYEIRHRDQRLAVVHPGVGAPLAIGLVEEIIALGCRTLVAVGGAGALVPDLALGHVIVVDSAVRDEGTSYHYLAPARTVTAEAAGVAALEATLRDHGVPFVAGRTWTTDAPFRETRSRVERRIAEGCLTVEMEAAAFFAVARYRRVRFAHLLYAGDSLAGTEWDDRGWTTATSIRERLFWLAADACLRLGARSD